jgi:hypothetical protein
METRQKEISARAERPRSETLPKLAPFGRSAQIGRGWAGNPAALHFRPTRLRKSARYLLMLWSIAFILIVLALRERMQASAPNLMRIAVIGVSITSALSLAAGLIGIVGMPSIVSAKDASAFRAVMAMFFGLITAADHALGWALLLSGWAALKTARLPKILSYVLVIKGVVMILEFTAQPLMLVGMLLGIVFWPWLGIVLLRSKS